MWTSGRLPLIYKRTKNPPVGYLLLGQRPSADAVNAGALAGLAASLASKHD